MKIKNNSISQKEKKLLFAKWIINSKTISIFDSFTIFLNFFKYFDIV